MMSDPCQALIEPRDIADLGRVIKSPDRRFTALVGAARLHPGRDLRGLDLGPICIGPEEDVAGYDFSGCLMRGAVLCGVDLRRARFDGCDLSGTDLRGARYTAKQMKTAQCDGCQTGDWPDRPPRPRPPVTLDPVADAVQTALRRAGDSVLLLKDSASDSYDEGHYAIAEALYAIVADWYAEFDGPEDEETLANRHNMISSILNQGRAAEAEAAFRAFLLISERVQGAEHHDVLVTRHTLARAMLNQGRAAEAEAAFRAVLLISKRVLGAEHHDVLATRHELARAILDQGRAAEAEAAFRAVLLISERVLGADHRDVLVTRYRLGQALLDQGRADEAALLLDALAGSPSAGEMSAQHRAILALQRARVADALGRGSEGAVLLAEAEAHLAALPNREHHVWRAINAHRAARQVAEGKGGAPGAPGGSGHGQRD